MEFRYDVQNDAIFAHCSELLLNWEEALEALEARISSAPKTDQQCLLQLLSPLRIKYTRITQAFLKKIEGDLELEELNQLNYRLTVFESLLQEIAAQFQARLM